MLAEKEISHRGANEDDEHKHRRFIRNKHKPYVAQALLNNLVPSSGIISGTVLEAKIACVLASAV